MEFLLFLKIVNIQCGVWPLYFYWIPKAGVWQKELANVHTPAKCQGNLSIIEEVIDIWNIWKNLKSNFKVVNMKRFQQKKKGTCYVDMHCALSGLTRCIGKGKSSKRVDNVNKTVAGWHEIVYGSGIYRSIGLSEGFQEKKKKRKKKGRNSRKCEKKGKNGKIGVLKWPYNSQFEIYYFHIAVFCRAVECGHVCLVSANSI